MTKTKGKKGGKRLTRAQLIERLEAFFSSHPDETFSFKQIFKDLRLDTHPLKMLAIDIMEEMAWDDFLIRVTDSSYKLADNTQTLVGTFKTKLNGRNSVIPDGSEKPIFVAERNSLFAMNGDKVRITMMARKRNHIREAQVTEIIQRSKDQFVGKLKVDKVFAYLLPNDNNITTNIIIPKDKLKKGKTNDMAVVKVISWPDSEQRNIIAEVVDILGKQGENDAEMHTILAQYGLPYKYPKEVEDAANKIPDTITAEELARREDFRDVWTCTIDPHDAKDFDDALSIRKLDNLWEVGVHIADVSHYVKEGSIIDKEAQKRATSVYLVDRTIPMLPERLCNFICSLRPDEEKLCYSVIFVMDGEANIKDWHLAHTVTRSNRRYCYEEVQEILEGKDGDYAEELRQLDRFAKVLRAKRFEAGSVDFDRTEVRFEIDETGKPVSVYFKRSEDANKLIEEFMLLANRTVAESIGKQTQQKGKKGSEKTFVYRIHESPDPEKLANLSNFVMKFGYKFKVGHDSKGVSSSINHLMADVRGKKE